MNLDHHTLGLLTFAAMTLAVFTGAMIFLSRRKAWLMLHVLLSIIAYILMFLTLWVVM
ncbi:hypothetical protein [Thermococcus sp.]